MTYLHTLIAAYPFENLNRFVGGLEERYSAGHSCYPCFVTTATRMAKDLRKANRKNRACDQQDAFEAAFPATRLILLGQSY